MQTDAKFSETGVAIVTPFKIDRTIDYTHFGNLIEYVIQGGVNYIVVLGSTGEAATIQASEKRELIRFAVKLINQRIPLVAGFSDNNSKRLAEEINTFDFSGVDAILSAAPAYNKPNQEGIYQHFCSIAKVSPVPIILYNVPGRTASNMTAPTVLKLASEFPNIVGIKEASANLEQCMAIVKGNTRTDFALLSGDDLLTLPLISLGFNGVISVVSNAFPAKFSSLVHLANAGEFSRAGSLHYELFPLIQLLFADGNPAGIKAALEIMGMGTANLRLPLVPVNETVYRQLKKCLKYLKSTPSH